MSYQKTKLVLTTLLFLFSVFVIFLTINFKFNVGELQNLFSIIGSFSIGLALITYLYKKQQDELSATIDQITFFREKIITEWNKLLKQIQVENPGFILSRIDLSNSTIDGIRNEPLKNEPSINFDRQLSVFFDPSKNYPDIYIKPALDGHILLLNMLEEFSLRVIHLKTKGNEAFVSVHNAFIEIVESNAVALVFMRDVKTCSPIYSAILELYNSWKNNVKKTPFIIKSLEEQGLINKKQKEDFYKLRKEKIGY